MGLDAGPAGPGHRPQTGHLERAVPLQSRIWRANRAAYGCGRGVLFKTGLPLSAAVAGLAIHRSGGAGRNGWQLAIFNGLVDGPDLGNDHLVDFLLRIVQLSTKCSDARLLVRRRLALVAEQRPIEL